MNATELTTEELTERKIGADMRKYLIGMGIYPSHAGYHYIVRSVIYIVMQGGKRTMLGQVYREVAAQMGVTAASVERGVRFVLSKCDERAIDRMNEYFGFRVFSYGGTLTASEFIYLFADKFLQEMY